MISNHGIHIKNSWKHIYEIFPIFLSQQRPLYVQIEAEREAPWSRALNCDVPFWNAPVPVTSSSTPYSVLRTEYSYKL